MGSESRRPDASLIEQLATRPAAFGFFQAVRLLERAGCRDGRRPLGFDEEPKLETVRLRGHPSLAFPAGDVRDLKRPKGDGESRPPELSVTFLGFLGAAGVLPQHYTELVVRRLQKKDPALLDWLDLLLHRTLSHFHRAWRKYRPLFSFEHARLDPSAADPVELVLRGAIGLATGGLEKRQSIEDDVLLHFAGHFAARRRTAAGLEQVAGGWLAMPVRVRQLVGRWLPIEREERSRMPERGEPHGRHHRLGRDLLLGERARDVSGKVRLEIGPLEHPEYLAILPGTRSHRALQDLVRSYAGPGVACDLRISFVQESLPQARLGGATTDSRLAGAKLGHDAWLGDPPTARSCRPEVFPLLAT